MAEERDMTMPCESFDYHNFKKIGSHRVPCHGSWSTNMPAQPDGTILYIDYKCRVCGQHYSEEALYSWRANTN